MNHRYDTSQIARVVDTDAQRFIDIDAEPGMNICGGTPECGNKEALEDLLTTCTANWFATNLGLPIQQVIYSPNRVTERRCGFDLSVGRFNSPKLRLRIQSKFSATWCDEPQLLSLPAKKPVVGQERLSEAERLFLQLELLCQTFTCSAGQCYPYLLVQQCYCLHEYRRMDGEFESLRIPNIDGLFRSMAIDLSNEEFRRAFAIASAVDIQLLLHPATERITCEAVFPGPSRQTLVVKSLPDLLAQLKKDS